MKVLITGGCGFIGHHVCEHLIKNTDWELIVFDSLTYASDGFNRLRDVKVFDNKRVKMLSADFTKSITGGLKQEIGEVDYIIHMGAETHVDNSIENAMPFAMSNVIGTVNMLEFARECPNLKLFVYFSTDEVFGPAPKGVAYKEWDRYDSGNPYSASKAGGEEFALAYSNTYKLPVLISHTMNVFGERQHPEKFIPLCIKKILKREKIQIHADSTKTISGSRYWIHARNVASALLHCINYVDKSSHSSVFRDKINIVGEKEVSNFDMARYIAKVLKKRLDYEMVDFHSSRPGHDLRYALDGDKLFNEWKFDMPKTFEQSLTKTIEWYLKPEWERWLWGITAKGVVASKQKTHSAQEAVI